jgi:hypothetical protein
MGVFIGVGMNFWGFFGFFEPPTATPTATVITRNFELLFLVKKMISLFLLKL